MANFTVCTITCGGGAQHNALPEGILQSACGRVQLMPMNAAGASFSKYAAVLFFMGSCISWSAHTSAGHLIIHTCVQEA